MVTSSQIASAVIMWPYPAGKHKEQIMQTISALGSGVTSNERAVLRVLLSETLDLKKLMEAVTSINGDIEEGYPGQELIASAFMEVGSSRCYQDRFFQLEQYCFHSQSEYYNKANVDYGMISTLIRLTQYTNFLSGDALESAAYKWLRRVLNTKTKYDRNDAHPGPQFLGFVKEYFTPSKKDHPKRILNVGRLLELIAKNKYRDDDSSFSLSSSTTIRQETIAKVITQTCFDLLPVNEQAKRLP